MTVLHKLFWDAPLSHPFAVPAAYTRAAFDETAQQFVEEIVKIDADGTRTVVADTRGEFSSFGFRPPSLNNNGDVAFLATLDDFTTSGIFVGPTPSTIG